MSRPHLASLAEDRWNQVRGRVLRARGWRPVVLTFPGYASADLVRVLGRAVLAPATAGTAGAPDGGYERRGWRNFVTAEVAHLDVTVTVAGVDHRTRTDRAGGLDVRLPNPGLATGWQEVTVHADGAEPVAARVFVVDPDADFGLVSDIDDTVLKTYLPRPLLAAYNTFLLTEGARHPVPGMARLYADLLAAHPGSPTFYVSTGAWNTAEALTRFLARCGFPEGPLLLTDWGPTETGWFRSGQQHKRACLESLVADLPRIRWVLVGDDGQHDPAIYADFARRHPERVRAIAIRELGIGEQVLTHGSPGAKDDPDQPSGGVPTHRAPDGHGLRPLLRGLR